MSNLKETTTRKQRLFFFFAIRHFRLSLVARFNLSLKDTFLVLSFRRNLVLLSLLDKFGYSCSFGNNQFYLSLNLKIVGTSFLKAYDNLYMLETVASYNEIPHVESRGTKHNLNKEN